MTEYGGQGVLSVHETWLTATREAQLPLSVMPYLNYQVKPWYTMQPFLNTQLSTIINFLWLKVYHHHVQHRNFFLALYWVHMFHYEFFMLKNFLPIPSFMQHAILNRCCSTSVEVIICPTPCTNVFLSFILLILH